MATSPTRAASSGSAEPKNVFILGHDAQHQEDVTQITGLNEIAIHALLNADELINQDHYDIDQMLNKARAILNSFSHVDAIVCHWDFPVTSMHSILCEEYNLPAPSLTSLLKCAHKYWSRLEQRKAVPQNTPNFCAVNPFDDNALNKIELDYPFWIKPIEGYGSMLGFKITSDQDFSEAMEQSRKVIKTLGDPFNTILKRVGKPPELEGIDGNWMIAEQYITGLEFAPEGYVHNGDCQIHGMIDMVIGSNGKSFERYEYPSTLPETVQQRGIEISKKLMRHVGFDNGCFNIEYFWNRETDDIWIVEINPRISQSHSYLFEKVKGLSNHEVAIKIALGEAPHFEQNNGPFKCAAKFLHRRYDRTNMIATRVPQAEDIQALQRHNQPHTLVHMRLQPGMELADMKEQDPYSYVIAEIMIAAQDQRELEEKYRTAAEQLPFEFAPLQRKVSEAQHQ